MSEKIDVTKLTKEEFDELIYGKDHVDSFKKFLDDKDALISSVCTSLQTTMSLSKELNDNAEITEEITNYLKIILNAAFNAGVNFQKTRVKEVKKPTNENITNINCMFTLDFSDNDFSSYFETAAEEWCNTFNKEVQNYELNIELGSCDDKYNDYLKSSIDALMDINNICKCLKSNVYIDSMIKRNEFSNYEKTFPSIEDLKEESEHNIEYLDITPDKIKYGSIQEIEEYVIEKYQNQQNKEWGDGKDFNSMWLNGEVLFIKIENGFATSWVK